MRRAICISLATAAVLACFGQATRAKNSPGTLDITARITPTQARPEPVRQFTFYILTKSYEDIAKDVEANDAPPDRDKFIRELKVSDQLKEWLKGHDQFDLTYPNLDKALTPDDVLYVPEFLLAYQRANSGGVPYGIPKPKYADADKTAHPDRYQKQHDEYFVALKKFIQTHPESMSGVELELSGVNPQSKWALLQTEREKGLRRGGPEMAQTKNLAAQGDSHLDGHAAATLPAGNYWVSTLNL